MVPLFWLAVLGGVALGPVRPSRAPVVEVRNGHWYTGAGFADRTFYLVDGILRADRPPVVDSVLDLAGGYVIPPFGDAHTHNLDGPFNLERTRAEYLKEGTFYVGVLTNTASRTEPIRSRFNQACDLDVAYANGGLTSTLSHPFLAYEPRALGVQGDWRTQSAAIRASRLRENDAYWFIDDAKDLESKWPALLAGRPDLIKIFLLDAAEAPPAMPDSGLPHGHGLRPSLVPAIVERAHRAGLRVAAHIETAADFAVAVGAGVDLMAHLPGYAFGVDDDGRSRLGASTDRYEIDQVTARRAGRQGLYVTPTVAWTFSGGGPDSAQAVAARQSLMRRNIGRLSREGVRFVVGSDWFGQTAWHEIEAMRRFGAWGEPELFRMWIETPKAIFPTRRIGKLEGGYEASFLVLDENPLVNFDAVRRIRLRVKQGCVLPHLAATP